MSRGQQFTQAMIRGDTFVLRIEGIEFPFVAALPCIVRGMHGTDFAFHDVVEKWAAKVLKLEDEADHDKWVLLIKMMHGTATQEERDRWTAKITGMRIRGEIDESTYARVKA